MVIGAGLAGMAAAARLAKARHQVTLLEARDRIGGAWATRDLDGITVDAAPPIFSFPAPWRDLFRKSGRALEAEFARSGEELVDAPPTRHVFADGSTFVLPISRGEQAAAIADRFGRSAADGWRDLVDSLGDVWQALRPLGIEAELVSTEQLTRSVKRTLLHRRSLADLAGRLQQPELAAIVGDLAYPAGSTPERTPAFCAVQLYLDRTFGRWTAGSSTMINSLEQRLALRKVDVRTGVRATGIDAAATAVRAVRTEHGELAADAVVATCDPDQLYNGLLAPTAARAERRRLRRLPAALAPTVSLRWADASDRGPGGAPAADEGVVSETIHHQPTGGPLIRFTRPVGDRVLIIDHDYRRPVPDPSAGVGWRGFRHWLDRPPITSSLPGLFTAGPFSRGGPAPSMQVLSGALAAYACQRRVAPDRPLEPR